MATFNDPEVILAQKLASNEKSIRTKALKKLRTYLNVRSQKQTGGFTSEEMLKLWKGLFYCLWMQDKPLLQEELSNSISALIHTFHDFNGQLLYLESSLKTFRREWTGIDRLRMDKFFQLIRFMFRQSFEILKRKNWDSSAVAKFLELFATEILNSGNDTPAGLQLHILDLYLTELAAVGSSELTADQNLRFIEPFCKMAAKTKDGTLFRAICNNIFSTIIDQAPYAIEDLMKELKAAQASDSGQSSDGDEEENLIKLNNGSKSYLEHDNELQSGDSDRELPFDDDDSIAPVLQFDYGAVADKLLEISSRSRAPSQNRQRLYKIIKVLQDLSQGLFPQDGYPEEVSTDEDDEMFGSRKRNKRRINVEEAAKNQNKKMKLKHDDDADKDDVKPTNLNDKNNTNQRKKKKKARQDGCLSANLNANMFNLEKIEVPNQSKILLESEDKATKQPSVSASDQASKLNSSKTNNKKGKKRPTSKFEENLGNSDTHITQEIDTAGVIVEPESASKTSVEFESRVVRMEAPANNEITSNVPELQALNTAKMKKTLKAQKVKMFTVSQKSPLDSPFGPCDNSAVSTALKLENLTDASALVKCKRKINKTDNIAKHITSKTTTSENGCASDHQMGTPLKKKKNRTEHVKKFSTMKKEPKVGEEASYSSKKPNKKKRKIPVVFEFEVDELESAPSNTDIANKAPSVKKKKEIYGSSPPKDKPMSVKTVPCDLVAFKKNTKLPTPLFFRAKGSLKTTDFGNEMCHIPIPEYKKVRFHLKNNKTAEFKKNDRSLLLSPEGTSKVPFDPKQKPKSGVLKSSPVPLFTNIKKTPKTSRKSGLSTPQSTPKRRPTAADFF